MLRILLAQAAWEARTGFVSRSGGGVGAAPPLKKDEKV